MTPEEQYELCLELLTPIKEKIYGVHIGNHEQRIVNETSMDLMKSLSRELDTKYLDSSCIHRIIVNGYSYILFTTHGSSGSTLPHTKMKFLRDFAGYIDADVYVAGHVHELDTASDVKLYLDIGDKMVKQRKRYYVLSGHYLKYGGYAEAKGYMPGKTGSPKIQLFGTKQDVHISI